MDNIYVLIYGSEWEDMAIFLSKEDAIKASINHYPKYCRIEIFSKTDVGYTPTYNYYKNGEYIEKS
jgi:hypothetical protein